MSDAFMHARMHETSRVRASFSLHSIRSLVVVRPSSFVVRPSVVESNAEKMSSAVRRVVVFGGNGYVGAAVSRALVESEQWMTTATGNGTGTASTSTSAPRVAVACASRSGAPPTWARRERWVERVEWVTCDALDAETCETTTRDADAVVTAIGALPMPWMGREEIVRLNGDTNVVPGRAAMMNGTTRLVVVGATIPPLVPGLAAYARGKALAETFARDEFACVDEGRSAVVLRPAAVSGTRRVGGGVSLPLSLVMDPARVVLRATGSAAALAHAPVPLENVARAAARAALDFECETFDRGFSVVSNASLITEDYYNLLKRKPA